MGVAQIVLKLKTLIKFIIYYFIDLLVFSSKEIKPKSILFIRLDAIGDYVMFRNFIKELKGNQEYKNYNITLLGNNAWKDLAEELDSDYIDSFVWLDRKRFNRDFIYRYKKLTEITSQGYEVILSPMFSREFFYADAIVKLVKAKEKIGSIGDLSNIKRWQKYISDKYYYKLIKADENIIFEFYRNKEFFENLSGESISITKPSISLSERELPISLPSSKYAVIFLGASADFRQWPVSSFAKVAQFLVDDYQFEIILCGATAEQKSAKQFKNIFTRKCVDLVGKTALFELLYVLQGAELLLSNETSAPHFSVALEMKNVFVISNGNHYGRFTPYPKAVSEDYHVIFHPEIEKDLDDYKKLSNNYGFGSGLNIHEISVESVKRKINDVL